VNETDADRYQKWPLRMGTPHRFPVYAVDRKGGTDAL
jgi:hypothetical protein